MDENGPLGDTAKSESEPSGIKAHECVDVTAYYDTTRCPFGSMVTRYRTGEAKPTERAHICRQCAAHRDGECRGREPSCDAAGNAAWPRVRGDDWCAKWR